MKPNERKKLAEEIRRARFDPSFDRIAPRDAGEAAAIQGWYEDTGSSARRRDLAALDRALRPGAYKGSSRIAEVIAQKDYIQGILQKYGDSDLEVRAVLDSHDVGDILAQADLLESLKDLPTEVKQRADHLATYWQDEGVELDAFEWLDVASRVEQGEEVRDVLREYACEFEGGDPPEMPDDEEDGWECEYCGAVFDTYDEAERHEATCGAGSDLDDDDEEFEDEDRDEEC